MTCGARNKSSNTRCRAPVLVEGEKCPTHAKCKHVDTYTEDDREWCHKCGRLVSIR